MTENTNKFDITSTVAEKGIDAAKGFLSKLIKPGVEETGLLIADQIRFFRYKNQINLLQKTEAYIKKKGLTVKEIPVKTIAPLLEGASLEEDDDLKQMWVGLLVNYVDSEKNFNSSVFPHILSQLSTNEGKFLKLYLQKIEGMPVKVMEMQTNFLEPEERISNAELGNLLRLGLIVDTTFRSTKKRTFSIPPSVLDLSKNSFEVTSLGIEFMKACNLED